MNYYYRTVSLAVVSMSALFLGGCTISFEGTDSAQSRTDGGVYKSATGGSTWQQSAAIATVSGQPVFFNTESILSLAIDPQDHEAIYAGTAGGGLLYSYDAGESWSIARSLGRRRVQAVAVNPLDKCSLVVASENKIYNTTDCARTWEQAYFDNDTSIMITSLAPSQSHENVVLAGTSRGEVMRSSDKGASWTVLKRFDRAPQRDNNAVIALVVSHTNPQLVWAGTRRGGVYRSADGGTSWQSFYEEFVELSGTDANRIFDLVLGQSDGRTVIAATNAGLLRSLDGGEHWQVMDLIPPADSISVNVLAIFATNSKRIYYATNTSFGWTEDGGTTWSSKKLPSTRRGIAVEVDPTDPLVVYLGVQEIKK